MRLINLNDHYVDVFKVSFIGVPDRTIIHNVKGASIAYWFTIVIDGKDIKISASTSEELLSLRQTLISGVSNRDSN
jgi:hypothetical protein